MRRSEINAAIRKAEAFLDTMRFALPAWAHWTPQQWRDCQEDMRELLTNQLGWDLTDFGSNNFDARGLTLFTCRNGNPSVDKKPYAEKIMVVQENQETPMHFHWKKMEDIINRGGGNLVIELYSSTEAEELGNAPLTVSISGMRKHIASGDTLVLQPGESICLEQGMYHRFYGEPDCGPVLVGEVSMVNDDSDDNRFLEPLPRFSPIEEDEEPYRLLATDYQRLTEDYTADS